MSVVFALVLAGCVFSPGLGDGQVRCGANGVCPPGQTCASDGGFCHVSTGSPDLGASGDLAVEDGGICVPATCPTGACGQIGNGCGRTVDCGNNCPANAPICGGGGPNVCGVKSCMPLTSCAATQVCGTIPDGCASTLGCGTCAAGQVCGGDGTPNRCCTPATTCPAGATCGRAPDGCGGVVVCGTCNGNKVCGGGGLPNVCGGKNTTCTPKTCAQQGKNCGSISDGCADVVNCGVCATGKTCVNNVCG